MNIISMINPNIGDKKYRGNYIQVYICPIERKYFHDPAHPQKKMSDATPANFKIRVQGCIHKFIIEKLFLNDF